MSTSCIRRFETLEDRAVLNGGIGGLHAVAGAAAAVAANVAANVDLPLCDDSVNIDANVDLQAQLAAVVDAALAACDGDATGDASASAGLAAAIDIDVAVGAHLDTCACAVDHVLAEVDSTCLPSATLIVTKLENVTVCVTVHVYSAFGKVAGKVDNLVDPLLCDCA